MRTDTDIILSKRNMVLPERVSVHELEIAGDILLFEGAKHIKKIMEEPDSQEVVIKAFNAAVNMQKYIVARRKFESENEDNSLDDDLGEIIGG